MCNYGADGDDLEYRRYMYYRLGVGSNPDEQPKPPAKGSAPKKSKPPRRDDPPEDSGPYVPVNTR